MQVKEIGSRMITPILEEEEPDDLMELSEEQDISSILMLLPMQVHSLILMVSIHST